MQPDDIVDKIFDSIKEKTKVNLVEVNEELSNKLKEEVFEAIEVAQDAVADGKISINEVIQIVIELAEIVQVAIEAHDILEEEEIKSLVINTLKEIYFSEDGLGDPDIAYIPNFIEGKIENAIFDLVLPNIIEYIIKLKNKNEK